MTTCDWCNTKLPLEKLSNVTYLNELDEPNGFANVLCDPCVEQIDEPADVWSPLPPYASRG